MTIFLFCGARLWNTFVLWNVLNESISQSIVDQSIDELTNQLIIQSINEPINQPRYREYHLELTKEIQFPIEMSFPWIITEHIVKTKRAMALGSAAGTKGVGDGSAHGSEGDPGGKGAGIAGDVDGGPLTPYGNKKKKKKGKGDADGGMGHVLVEEMLWALDLYNDAAHRALYVLNSQYLFNEIQVNWIGGTCFFFLVVYLFMFAVFFIFLFFYYFVFIN